MSIRDEINMIKLENLTGQQLRMARRLALKHNFEPTSDLDAVRLLRSKGIDPFSISAALNVPAPKEVKKEITIGGKQQQLTEKEILAIEKENSESIKLPVKAKTQEITHPNDNNLQRIADLKRIAEIKKIQVNLVRRRRLRLLQMFTKLAIFIGLPTLIAGYYFYAIASPMYSTYTDFVIEESEPSPLGGISGALSKVGIGGSPDASATQAYISSRPALAKLEEVYSFKTAYQSEDIDVMQRLEKDATNERTHRLFAKKIRTGYDPTIGILKMEVVAPTPEASFEISKALIKIAEENADAQSYRKRQSLMKSSEEDYKMKEIQLKDAQQELLRLREKYGTVSTELTIGQLMGEVSTLRAQISQKKITLAQQSNNIRPNQTKVRATKAAITELKHQLGEVNDLLTKGTPSGTESQAAITSKMSSAEAAVIMHQETLGFAYANKENAALSANMQTRFISVSTPPVLPDEASYPRKFENTLLSFLVFLGIFLMISLTASILREQVSS